MSSGIALWKGDTWDVGWGVAGLDQDGTLTVSTANGTDRITLSLPNSPFVDLHATEASIYAVGAADEQVVLATRDEAGAPRIAVIATICRLGKGIGETFASHSVRFHPRPERDECVLTWELGVALVSPRRGCIWLSYHDDPEQRVRRLTEDQVDLAGFTGAMTINLVDGAILSRSEATSIQVDHHILTEWRRGIGR